VSSTDLLKQVTDGLWSLADDAAKNLATEATTFAEDPGAPDPIKGRLLQEFATLPAGNPLVELVREVLGELPAGGPVRLHGWRRAGGAPLGVALVATQGSAMAVLAVTPGSPTQLDVVVSPGATISADFGSDPWKGSAAVSAAVWDTVISPGVAPDPPQGTVTIDAARTTPVTVGPATGPGFSVRGIAARLTVSPAASPTFRLELRGFRAALLPPPIADLLGAGGDRSTAESNLHLVADRAEGLRFDGSGLRVELPGRLALPGVTARDFAVEMRLGARGPELGASLDLRASLPGLPVGAQLDGIRLTAPFAVDPNLIGPVLDALDSPLPDGLGIELTLPMVSGGGAVAKLGEGSYGGVLELALGVLRVQGIAVVDLPQDGKPVSILVLLTATFPYPGIQIGFGFAIDAVGGLVGINRGVDTDALRALVSDGNVDRVLFPENAVARAREITGSLETIFPPDRGHHVIAPMVRINWGGRLVTISGALVLAVPGRPQVLLLGRLLVAIPDPAAPLIRLQASVLGKIDLSVPETEVLVSLAGSRIVAVPVSGEVYLLARGGENAVFVLSAGGFHPRYTRPPRVPELDRLTIDLGGGYLGLRAEAYLAVTSNALMFGADVQLDATIAGCGVEGRLGLDALFRWEPTFSFSVRVYAHVAVLAFGHHLAGVGLDFTLEGPAPFHAFGTGRISILWWHVSLDFDVRWGDAPQSLPRAPEIQPQLEDALRAASAWSVERPPEERSPVRLTDTARDDLAKGRAVEADARVRVNQTVVPLDTTISRFARSRIPDQRWSIAADGEQVRDDFMPAEFFDLTEDEQLTAPAFLEFTSGARLGTEEVRSGTRRPVDDSYETGYKVEPGFQPSPPGRQFGLVAGNFALETFARVTREEERLTLWRATQAVLPTDKVVVG
jgi:uncharacterized protein DUF6603